MTFILKLLLFILAILSFGSINKSYAIVKGNFSLSVTTGNYFYVDHNNCSSGGGPRAAYLGVKIRNVSGASQNNIAVQFVKYTDSTRYTLAGGQASSQMLPVIANNANDTFFWYSTYPCLVSGSYPTNVIFRVKDLDDGTSYLDTLVGLDTDEQISSNGGGLVGTSQITRQDPVGGIFAFKCNYNYPKLVAGDISYMQPTTNLAFDASSYQLEAAEILSSTANSASCIPVGNCPMNYNISGTCNSFDITVEYRFRILNAASTTAYPYNSATSGAVGLKYVITTVPVSLSPSSLLPVSLTEYNVKADNGNVLNTWTTASEWNNDYFTIERSVDGIEFEVAGVVDGAGNSNSIRHYSFTDVHPFIGVSYYRLKQTDFDGTVSYSKLLSVNITTHNEPTVTVFPNPSAGQFNLVFNAFQRSDVHIKIFDITGRIFLDRHIDIKDHTTNYPLDLKGIEKGEYFISYTSDQIADLQKIVIQ